MAEQNFDEVVAPTTGVSQNLGASPEETVFVVGVSKGWTERIGGAFMIASGLFLAKTLGGLEAPDQITERAWQALSYTFVVSGLAVALTFKRTSAIEPVNP